MGGAGAAWIAELPRVIEDLQQRWSITLGRPLPGGSSSYVVRVRRADGSPAVLKISLLTVQIDREVAVLRRADGRGYARLLDHDLSSGALLLESLGPTLAASGRSPEEQLVVLAETLQEAWLSYDGPEPAGADDKAVAAEPHRLGLVSARSIRAVAAVDQALRYAELLWGDALAGVAGGRSRRSASGNALTVPRRRPGRDRLLLRRPGRLRRRSRVRPRCHHARLLGRRDCARPLEAYAQLLADRTGVDVTRIWRWAYLERVSTGLYVLGFGSEAVGRPFLDSAERLLD